MKTKLIILLMMLMTTSVKSQAYLGYNKAELVEAYLNAHTNETFETEWKQMDNGNEYVMFSQGVKMKTYFFDKSHGLCYLYVASFTYENINAIITLLNETYVRNSEYVWIDYSGAVALQWRIEKYSDYYNLIVSVK